MITAPVVTVDEADYRRLLEEREHLRLQRDDLQRYAAKLLEERTRPAEAEVGRLRREVVAVREELLAGWRAEVDEWRARLDAQEQEVARLRRELLNATGLTIATQTVAMRGPARVGKDTYRGRTQEPKKGLPELPREHWLIDMVLTGESAFSWYVRIFEGELPESGEYELVEDGHVYPVKVGPVPPRFGVSRYVSLNTAPARVVPTMHAELRRKGPDEPVCGACGAPDASWRGGTLRQYLCDACGALGHDHG